LGITGGGGDSKALKMLIGLGGERQAEGKEVKKGIDVLNGPSSGTEKKGRKGARQSSGDGTYLVDTVKKRRGGKEGRGKEEGRGVKRGYLPEKNKVNLKRIKGESKSSGVSAKIVQK